MSSRAKKTAARKRNRARRRFWAGVERMREPEILYRPALAPDSIVAIDRAWMRELEREWVKLKPLEPKPLDVLELRRFAHGLDLAAWRFPILLGGI